MSKTRNLLKSIGVEPQVAVLTRQFAFSQWLSPTQVAKQLGISPAEARRLRPTYFVLLPKQNLVVQRFRPEDLLGLGDERRSTVRFAVAVEYDQWGDEELRTLTTKARPSLSPRLRWKILNRDGFRCTYCGVSAQVSALEVDHVIPLSAGGPADDSNLTTACQTCNAGKADDPVPGETDR